MTSSVTNYFKSYSGDIYFFVDSVPESIETAWGMVTLLDKDPSVFRPVVTKGPWDRCKIIGHRSYAKIRSDLSVAADRQEREAREAELAALQLRYAQAAA